MSDDAYLNALNPDIIERFRVAIEIGRWPDGRELTPEQRETCIQAIIMYEHKHLPEEKRTGYVPPKETPCATDDTAAEDEAIKWK